MKNEANSNAGRHGACTAEGWVPVKTRDARKPEVGTEDALLHCGEDWSVDAFAHKPNKYCTYNLAPKCGPYSLAPGLSRGGPRGTHNATRYVSCIYRARIWLLGLVRWMSQAAFQRDMFCSIWQSVQTSTDLQNTHFDWPHHKWAVHGSNFAVVQHLKMSTGCCYINTTSQFFFFFNETRTLEMLTCLKSFVSKQANKQKSFLMFSPTMKLFYWTMTIKSN